MAKKLHSALTALFILLTGFAPSVFAQSLPSAGLKVHLKADAGTSTTTNGSSISSWTDQSGNGNNATQAVSENRPTYVTSGIGGQPALRFSGSSELRLPTTSTIGITNSDYEMFFVSKTSNGGIQFLISGTAGIYEIHLNGAAGQRFMPTISQLIDVSGNTSFTDGVAHIHSARVSDTYGVSRVDGWDVPNGANGRSSSDLELVLGSRADGSYRFVGDISEVILYNRVLTATERATVEKYLRDKYAVLPFLPRTGLKSHLKAGTLLSGVSNGGSISSWPDMSGNGNHGAQASGSWQPTFVTNSMNGHPAIYFDGTASIDLPTAGALGIQNSDYELFIASKSSSGNIQFLFSGGVEEYELHLNGASGQRFIPFSGYNSSTYIDLASNGSFTDGSPRVFSARASNTGGASRVNGSESSASVNARANSNAAMRLGVRSSGDFGLIGEIAEAMIYNRNLSSDERATVERYFQEKYAISAENLTFPVASLSSIEAPTESTISLTGSVHPKGVSTTYYFAYGTSRNSLSSSTSSVSAGSGTSPVSVDGSISGLTPGQTYYVSLVAQNANNTDRSDTLEVMYEYPTVSLTSATSNQSLSAQIEGFVNPNGFATNYYFKWGTTRSALSDSSAVADAGNGVDNEEASREIENLTAGQTYFVTLIAYNSNRRVSSDTLEFNFKYSSATVDTAIVSPTGTALVSGKVTGNGYAGTARFLYSWNDGASKDSTAAFMFSGSAVDSVISVSIPLAAADEAYSVRLVAQNNFQRFVSDSFEFDNFYSDITGLGLSVSSNLANAGIRVQGTLQHGGRPSSYQIFYSTVSDNFLWNSAVIHSTLHESQQNEPIDQVVGAGELDLGQNYFVYVQTNYENGKSWISDTLQIEFRQTQSDIYDNYRLIRFNNISKAIAGRTGTQATQDIVFGAKVFGTIIPNGFETTYKWVWGSDRNNLTDSTYAASIGSGNNPVELDNNIYYLQNASTYYVALQAKAGNTIVSSDTLEIPITVPTFSNVVTSLNQHSVVTFNFDANPQGAPLYTKFIYSWNGGANTDSTEATYIGTGSSPIPTSRSLTLPAAENSYTVQLVVRNERINYQVLQADFDNYFLTVNDVTAAVGSSTPGSGILVSGNAVKSDNLGHYYVLWGTNRNALSSSSDTLSTTEINPEIGITFGESELNYGSTYYAVLRSRQDAFGNIWSSDTLEVTYVQPESEIKTLAVKQDFSAAVSGVVRPNGFATTYKWVWGTTRSELNDSTSSVSAGSGFDSTNVQKSFSGLTPNQTFFVALHAKNGANLFASDTLEFDTKYSLVTLVDVAASTNLSAVFSGTFETQGLETSGIIKYGTSRNNLNASENLGTVSNGAFSESINGFTSGQTYFASVEAVNAFKTFRSDTLEFRFVFASNLNPTAFALDSTTVRLTSDFRTNGLGTTIRFAYGESAASLADTTSGIFFAGNEGWSSVADTLFDAPKNDTVFVQMLADNGFNVVKSSVVSVSTRLPRNLLVDAFETSGIRAGNFKFSYDPNGNATYFNILWGTNPNPDNFTNFADTAGYNYPAGTERINVSYPVSNLTPGTNYARITVYEKVNFGDVRSEVFSFTIDEPRPVLTISEPEFGQGNAITFKGTVNPNGSQTTYSYVTGALGEWDMEIPFGDKPSLNGTTVQNADIAMDSLGNGNYFVTMKAVNPYNTTYSDTLFFTMYRPFYVAMQPVISSGQAVLSTGIATNSSEVVEAYFEYGSAKNALNDTTAHVFTESGSYYYLGEEFLLSATLTGLSANQKVYYRAVSKMGSATKYAEVDSFNVRYFSDLAVLSMENTSSTTALVKAQFNPNGFDARAYLKYGQMVNQLIGYGDYGTPIYENVLQLDSVSTLVPVSSANELLTYSFPVNLSNLGQSRHYRLDVVDTVSNVVTSSSVVQLSSETLVAIPTLSSLETFQDGSVRIVGSVDPRTVTTNIQLVWGTNRNNLHFSTPARNIGYESVFAIDTVLTGFTVGQDYYLAIKAEAYGVSYSDTVLASFQFIPITSKTASVSNYSDEISADFGATVDPIGTETLLRTVFGLAKNALTDTSNVSNLGSGFGAVTTTFNTGSLLADTTYYYQIQAIRNGLVSKTTVDSVSTRFVKFELTGFEIIGSNAVRVNGYYKPNGFNDFSLIANLTIGQGLLSTIGVGVLSYDDSVAFNFEINNLQNGTTYNLNPYVTYNHTSPFGMSHYPNTLEIPFILPAPTLVFNGITINNNGDVFAHATINPNGYETTFGFEVRSNPFEEFYLKENSDGSPSPVTKNVLDFIPSDSTLSGTEPIEISMYLTNPYELAKSNREGFSLKEKLNSYLGAFKATNELTEAYSNELPFGIYKQQVFVTSLSDENEGFGQHGTLRYVLNGINAYQDSAMTAFFNEEGGGGIRKMEAAKAEREAARKAGKARLKKDSNAKRTHGPSSDKLTFFDRYATVDLRFVYGTINLTEPLPPINYNLELIGLHPDSLIIDGGNAHRPFFTGSLTGFFAPENQLPLFGAVEAPEPYVLFENFTIANGRAKGEDGVNGGGGGAGMGGALFVNEGEISLNNIRFQNNSAVGGSGSSYVSGLGGRGGNLSSDVTATYLGGSLSESGTNGRDGMGGGGESEDFYPGIGGFGAGGGASGNANALKSGHGGFGAGAGANANVPGKSGYGATSATTSMGGNGAGLGGSIFNRSGYIEIDENVNFVNSSVSGGTLPNGRGSAIFSLAGDIYYYENPLLNGEYVNYDTLGRFFEYYDAEDQPQNVTNLAATYVSETSATITFTKGTGTGRMIAIVEDDLQKGFIFNDLKSRLFASPELGNQRSNYDGVSLIYADTGSSVLVTGLTSGKSYSILGIEYTDTLAHNQIAYYDGNTLFEYRHLYGASTITDASGSSLRFDGEDDYVTLKGPGVNFGITNTLSLQAWIRPDSVNRNQVLISNSTGSSEKDDFTLRISSNGALQFINTTGNNTYTISSPNYSLKAGRWQHVAVLVNGARRDLMIDGRPVASDSTIPSNILYNNTDSIKVGMASNESFYAGLMDEVRISNVTLTKFDILDYLFYTVNNGENLLGYFQFNEEEGTTTANGLTGESSTLRNFNFNETSGWSANGFPKFGLSVSTEYVGGARSHGRGITYTQSTGNDFTTPITVISGRVDEPATYLPTSESAIQSSSYFVFTPADTAGVPYTLQFDGIGIPMGGSVNQYSLYFRPFTSDTAWTKLNVTANNVTSNAITFNNVTARGEFIIGRTVEVNYTATRGSAWKSDEYKNYASLALPNSAVINDQFTIETWFKITFDDDGGESIQFLTSRQNEEMEIHVITTTGSIRFIPVPGVYVDSPTGSFVLNEWTHIACTFDGNSNVIKMYINGKEVSTSINVSPPYTNAAFTGGSVKLGTRGSIYRMHGQLDELRIWKSARSASEIWDNFRKTLTTIDENLLAYIQFNEGSGYSSSDTGNDAFVTLNVDQVCEDFYNEETQEYEQVCTDGDLSGSWTTSTIPILEHSVFTTQLTGTQGWRFLASPVSTTVGGLMNGLWTQGFEGATTTAGAANVYTWSTAGTGNASSNWTAASSSSNTISAGSGIATFVFADDNGPSEGSGSFPKTLSVVGNETSADQNLTSRLNGNVGGWTLLGNPFGTKIQWNDVARSGTSNSVYIWDHNTSAWKTWNGSVGSIENGEISAFNGFFVYTMAESPTFAIPKTARSFGANPFLGKQAHVPSSLALKLSAGGLENKTWVSFDENSTAGFDANDAVKLTPLSGDYAMIASVIPENMLLDINSLPFEGDVMEIPISVIATKGGTFSLSLSDLKLPEGWVVRLLDNETGNRSDLTQAYTFTHKVSAKSTKNGFSVEGITLATSNSTPRFTLIISKTATAIESIAGLPKDFELNQNYPNPFNPSTTIKFALPQASEVNMEVFDITGRRVATLVNEQRQAGYHEVRFDARRLSSGMYLIRMQAGGKQFVKKMTLLK